MESSSEEVESVTEEGLTEPTGKVPQRPRTDLQKAALEKARVKALQVRQENAALRRKERELEVARAAKEKADRSKRLQEEYEELRSGRDRPQRPEVVTEVPEDEDDEQEVVPKPKRKRRIIVTEAEDESDEDIEVVLPKNKPPPQDEVKMQRLMEKMFTM